MSLWEILRGFLFIHIYNFWFWMTSKVGYICWKFFKARQKFRLTTKQDVMKTIIKLMFTTASLFSLLLYFPIHSIEAQNQISRVSPTVESVEKSVRFDHYISGHADFFPGPIPFEGLKISFSNVGETMVEADGTYSMAVPRHWSGTATPYLCDGDGYIFEPPFINYVDVVFDKTDQNYSGEATTNYTISGRFIDQATGEPIANTEIKFNLSGGAETGQITLTTNEFGEYSFERLPCWSNTLDPFLEGLFYFEPKTRSYAEISSNQTEQDYEVIFYDYPIPTGWETINTGTFAFIAVDINSNPDICDLPINIGDLLGVFYTDNNGQLKCGGYGRWQDETNVFISAQGDDNTTSDKDGFASFEEYIWKIYSYGEEIDYPADVEMSIGNNYWSSFGLSKVGVVDGYYEHNLQISQGWSGTSSYTELAISPALITSIMSPIIGDLIIIQTLEKMYYPGAGVNNLLVWNSGKGYKIKVENDVVLPMDGCPKANTTINLSPTWNLIPVLSKCDVFTDDLFAQIADKLIMVKEIGGTGIYWPEMQVQSLDVIKSGSAYLVAVSGSCSLTFEPCITSKKNLLHKNNAQPNLSTWATPLKTGSSHSFLLQQGTVAAFKAGDYFGAYTQEGICAGLTLIEDPEANALITVFGDDFFTTEKDGLGDAEQIIFKVFKSGSGDEVIVHATFDDNYQTNDKFVDNGISVITDLELAPSNINKPNPQIRFYPNPCAGFLNFDIDPNIIFNVKIQNISGQTLIVQQLSGNQQLDLSNINPGIYFLKMESGSISITEKLILK